ncbi:DUF6477 family protein [Plastorhodobacter daqingensis]|uniref:DUF6477 family protein n=1 Tax=Plastorhodobacter daqingensis TaxID=1387281 RepID=A0ABW2UFE7_9RHOB
MSQLGTTAFDGTDVLDTLQSLRRPRLLIRAARAGMTEYRRDRDLRKLLRMAALPAPARALDLLLHEEARLNQIRTSGDACYNVARHVLVMIAILGEARLLPRPVIAAAGLI